MRGREGAAVRTKVSSRRHGRRWSLAAAGDAARAQVFLLLAWWVVRTRRRGKLVVGWPTHPGGVIAKRGETDRIALGVDRAARFGVFRPKCLVRSIALRWMLDRAGISPIALRVGVRWREGRFDAHAWVEVAGRPVGRDGRIAHLFEAVDDIEVLAR